MNHPTLSELRTRLDDLRDEVDDFGQDQALLARVHPQNHDSAANLLHYLALRSNDLRPLQSELSRWGLSSLGRCEAHVLPTIDLVRSAARALLGEEPIDVQQVQQLHDDFETRLEHNSEALFGARRSGRATRVMVTLPTEAAEDPHFIEACATRGSALFRINTAHDDEDTWSGMIDRIRALPAEHSARVFVDLAGPKLRTGPIAEGPQVRRLRPGRDPLGRPVTPVVVRLSTVADELGDGLPVTDAGWLRRRQPGDVVRFSDARNASRKMTVVAVDQTEAICELLDTSYLVTGTELVADTPDGGIDAVVIGRLPAVEQRIRLHRGDDLIVTADLSPADPMAEPASIGCSLPEVLVGVQVGDRIFFDDGKFGGRVVRKRRDELVVQIADIDDSGAWLRAGKGINLPDSDLDLPGLTDEDRAVLPFIVAQADGVEMSFVNTAADVAALRAELAALSAPDFPFVIKVETARAFSNLPEILMEALRSPHVGVMIARGDLAVEAGYARMGELQEEIMWLCEAAHVPVIWATQVLENLARSGRPSRAEVTDAALSVRSEAVMLNKGPFILDAVGFLDHLLTRMSDHLDKKSALLRRLRLGSGD